MGEVPTSGEMTVYKNDKYTENNEAFIFSNPILPASILFISLSGFVVKSKYLMLTSKPQNHLTEVVSSFSFPPYALFFHYC